MWFQTSLEEVYRLRTVRIRGDFLAACIVKLRHLAYERYNVAQELHQSSYAHVLACANAEHGENRACNKSLANALAQLVLCKSLLLKEFLHQSLVVLGSCLYQSLVQLVGLLHFLLRDVHYGRHTSIRTPSVHLHQQHVDDGVESGARAHRILNLHALLTVNRLHVGNNIVKVALVRIQLVHEEDYRLVKFLRITEVVLCANLRTILSVYQDNGLVGYVQGCDGSTNKIIATRTVYNIQFLVVPFYMENGRKYRIAIFVLHWEVVAHRIVCFYRSTALDYSATEKHRLGKGGLAATRTAKKGNVLNLICLIDPHKIQVLNG